MAGQPVSLRGPTGAWRGRTTLNVSDTGQKKWLKLENVYVSSDGSELRHAFGLRTLLDLSPENEMGYERYSIDALKPIFSTTPDEAYQYRYQFDLPAGSTLTLESRAKPTHIHGFAQIADQLILFGESRFRESPIYNSAGEKLSITNITTDGSGQIQLTLSGTPALRTAGGSPGLNGLRNDNVVFVEDVNVDDEAAQAIIDVEVNGMHHTISAVGTGGTTLVLESPTNLVGSHVAGGEIHVTRNNLSNANYPVTSYTLDLEDRIDDPDALTSWRVLDRLDPSNVGRACFPAWVANRQRDFGDERSAGVGEGILFTSSPLCSRGQSRRFQRELPYRVQPEFATDRLILAAPGYGCLFQIPVKITDDPLNIIAESLGSNLVKRNDEHYKPRALGIPKAVLVECVHKTPPASEAQDLTLNFDFMVACRNASPTLGLTAGEWKVAVAYEDDALGEEGIASETVTVTIPSNPGRAYTIRIPFLHPGYLMGETLANKINIYLAPPGQDALAYYASFHLANVPKTFADVNGSNKDLSAVYGFHVDDAVSTATIMYVRTIVMPIPDDGSLVEDSLDPERLAPQSAAMPRGAQAARYVRGVLLSGGHVGNVGTALELWESRASHQFQGEDSSFDQKDQIQIRERGQTLRFPDANTDGELDDSTLGIAGRNFPSAYQGIDFIHRQLLPSGREYHKIDRVVNRRVTLLSNTNAFHERLRLTRDVVSRRAAFGVTPSVQTTSKTNQRIWYVLPKGQMEVGDPGAPSRSSKAFIQFTDPNAGHDITAIGQTGAFSIVCSMKETLSYGWNRNPGGEVPRILDRQFGCIASSSMVEFDGGLAWMSERGPVAFGGAGVQHVGLDVIGDFDGGERVYLTDSRGMMRHCWGVHDAARGLVMWGLVTARGTQTVTHKGVTYTWSEADDEVKSRFPCDEVLIWNYRQNAFSTWRPPTGLEALWMAPVSDISGEVVTGILCADKRIYALADTAQDTNFEPIEVTLATSGRNSTLIGWTVNGPYGIGIDARNEGSGFLKEGMLVELMNVDYELVGETVIASIQAAGVNAASVVLAAGLTWEPGYKLRVGARQRATLVSTFLGGSPNKLIDVRGGQVVYTLAGTGTAQMRVTMLGTTRTEDGPTVDDVQGTDPEQWKMLGHSTRGLRADGNDNSTLGHASMIDEGGIEATSVAVKLEITGSAQTRIADILLDVA